MHPVQQVVNKGVQIRKPQGQISLVLTEGNILHSNHAGETVHVPINSHRTRWVVKCSALTV